MFKLFEWLNTGVWKEWTLHRPPSIVDCQHN